MLPIVPEGSISPEKAREAVGILVRLLEEEKTGSTSSAKCVVKCLGVLLGFCDLGDWDSVKLPFETLLKWSLDKRPKVRKCAVLYLESALKSFQSGNSNKKASKLILSLLESNVSLADKLGALTNVDGSETEKQFEAERSDVVHVLNVARVAVPYLSDKIRIKVVRELAKLLHARSFGLTRLILNSIEAFLDIVEVETITQEAEYIIDALSLYVSSNNVPKDTVIPAANLLKIALDKVHAGDLSKWNKNLPLGFNAIAGLLTRESDIALQSSNILKNMIDHQLSGIDSQPVSDGVMTELESDAIASMCSSLMRLLDACAGIPNEHALAVLSVLFLKLGRNSIFYMKNIVLKLAEIFVHAVGDECKTCDLQKCFGSGVVAMGTENVLDLVPISFDMEKMTCSNIWLLPILKKYTFGASLAYFMEHIVPIAESLERASHKVKNSVIRRDLQAYARGVWGLLPAFCRHPDDISQSFESVAKLLLVRLEKDTSIHEDIGVAVQELVKQNKCFPKGGDASEPRKLSSDSIEDRLMEKRSFYCYSMKMARKNIKALSSYSYELLQAMITIFLDSSSEKRSSLRKAITCLASISDSSVTKKIIISSLTRFPLVNALTDRGECDISDALIDDVPCDSRSKTDDPQWCLVLDLASSVVDGADEDLINLIFRLTKQALHSGDATAVSEAYNTLSCVLEGHPGFCSSKMDELVDLLTGLKSPEDVGSLGNRLTTLQILFVHALKSIPDVENKKCFLILNEIILALKDSKEEARKIAYDVLLRISSSLGGSSASNPDGPYNKLISMILGYFSGPSPHITSAAVSALSVLVFKEPELCIIIPDVVPSVTSLLHTKAVEVIKAVLGFIKVLVSCIEPQDLQNFVSVIVDGVLPWSSVSRHHFRSKVTIILEIMIRKCGLPTVKLIAPERYQAFVKKVSLSRHGKTSSLEAHSTNGKPQVSDVSENRQKKRLRNEKDDESGSVLHRKKRRNQTQDSHAAGAEGRAVGDSDKKTNHFSGKHKNSRMANGPRKPKPMKGGGFARAPGKRRKSGGANNKLKQ